MHELTVLDLFCGAGGFSEGFRQQGFRIQLGVDHWKPAIDTFNHNFDLNCKVQDMLKVSSSIEEIELLPDTAVIIGSPPCVSFSNSNRSGKADKSMGLRLIKAFLRIVAVKKFKSNSTLQAWYMENVTRSIPHLPLHYSFDDLGLGEWAEICGKTGDHIAIRLASNSIIVNSADFGSAQARKRVISGEIVKVGQMVAPVPTNSTDKSSDVVPCLPAYRTLGSIRQSFPAPNEKPLGRHLIDPMYPEITLNMMDLTDHFYDTGLYQTEWKKSMYLKTNHPYMGLMSFPENENKPSRTITATKIGTSREAIIYRSEYGRIGDGEYRTHTIREAATLMSFPITFQFLGSEGAKWRLVGNAVCPSVSRSFARTVRLALKLFPIVNPMINKTPKLEDVKNLNTFTEKVFDSPPVRNRGSRFRRHPFKHGNITVTLSNYDMSDRQMKVIRWITSVQYGNGDGYPTLNFEDNYFKCLEPVINKFQNGTEFLEIINNGFSSRIADSATMQAMYEAQQEEKHFLEPTALIEKLATIIDNCWNNDNFTQKEHIIFPNKDVVPQSQIMALYAINKITTVANESSSFDHADTFH